MNVSLDPQDELLAQIAELRDGLRSCWTKLRKHDPGDYEEYGLLLDAERPSDLYADKMIKLREDAYVAGQERMRERAAQEAYPEGAAKRIRALEPEPLEP